MSLAVTLTLEGGSLMFTDSCATESITGAKASGHQKSLLIQQGVHFRAIGFTGEAEINGKSTIDLLRKIGGMNLCRNDLESLAKALHLEFCSDIKTFPWESDEDRSDYIKNAKVCVHILTSPTDQQVWNITPSGYSLVGRGVSESMSGVLECAVFQRNMGFWIPKSVVNACDEIIKICTTNKCCDFPVDVTSWFWGSSPVIVRCLTPDELCTFVESTVEHEC